MLRFALVQFVLILSIYRFVWLRGFRSGCKGMFLAIREGQRDGLGRFTNVR